jgi:hypothetical protein
VANQQEHVALGSDKYRALGLIGNPFENAVDGRAAVVSIVGRAAALRFTAALLDDDEGRPIWLRTSPNTPDTYNVFAVAEILRALGDDAETDLLVGYVPLELFRLGRIRGTLGVIAERIASPSLGRTLAAYIAQVLNNIDASLPEASSLDDDRLAQALDALEADPEEATAQLFGPCVLSREDAGRMSELLQVESFRQNQEEPNPEEGLDAVETSEDLPAEHDGVREDGASEELLDSAAVDEAIETDPVFEYVIAHTKAHLSPVIARALVAYKMHGTGIMGQELKITKAPRKTLAALCAFASHRYKHVVVFHDQFEAWASAESNIRVKIASAVTEVRWAIAPVGVVAIAMAPGTVPEIEEQFAAARIVDWTLPEIAELTAPGAADVAPSWEVVRSFIDSAQWPGATVSPSVYDVVHESLTQGGSLDEFRQRAANAVTQLAQQAQHV